MLQEHFLTLANQDDWRRHLPADRSVFGSFGYARICAEFRNCSPRLYVVELDGATICYPLLLRPLAGLPFEVTTEAKWDACTPDFTGPLMFGGKSELAAAFPASRSTLFQREGIVAEFAHLHPWVQADKMFQEDCVYNREIVWVDVSLDPEILWRDHFEHSCRKNINRAEKEGVRVFTGSSEDHIREFHRVYCETMNRNNAESSYYFPCEFFKAVREELPENSRFVLAEYRDQIVAATLYLYDDHDVFSFLGGADAAFQHVRPTNAVIWKTIRWAHEAGKKRLILGGGYKPDDGIFRFKSSFSRFRQPFYVYTRIHLHQDYGRFEQRCREFHGLNGEPISYFPSYRYAGTGERKPNICVVVP